MNIFEYDFGYSWFISYGFAVPLAVGIVLAAVATWRRWRPWVFVLSGVIIAWSAAALFVTNVVWGINKPMTLPTERFLQSGSGRVLDAWPRPWRALLVTARCEAQGNAEGACEPSAQSRLGKDWIGEPK